jgi:hypothetical protein
MTICNKFPYQYMRKTAEQKTYYNPGEVMFAI